ncbi:hypothetical protein B0H13DRAFT_875440 [Mycena leptocephala]|nr:hypothetical protein B0H13DRAFT_875440 [Mycena leptocephala]
MLRMLWTKMSGPSLASPADCYQFVVQFPNFIRILQARWLLQSYLARPFRLSPNLYNVRLLLSLSWDDIRAALSALRRIIGGGTRSQVIAGTITLLALASELYPASMPSLISDLAVGMLHLIQRISARDVFMTIWRQWTPSYWDIQNVYPEWGRLIRASPHSHEPLQTLHDFVPPWDSFPSSNCPWDCLCPSDIYNVVKWLKVGARPSYVVRQLLTIGQAHPEPPLELIARWQSYLNKSRDVCGRFGKHGWEKKNTDTDFETTWHEASVVVNKLFDEEALIRCLEHIVEEKDKRKSDSNSDEELGEDESEEDSDGISCP